MSLGTYIALGYSVGGGDGDTMITVYCTNHGIVYNMVYIALFGGSYHNNQHKFQPSILGELESH